MDRFSQLVIIFLIFGCTQKQKNLEHRGNFSSISGYLVWGGYQIKVNDSTPRLDNGDYIIDDIAFPKSSFVSNEEMRLSALGSSNAHFRYLWPDSTIPYVIDASVLKPNEVMTSLTFLNNTSAMTLVPRTNEPDYVIIKEFSECGLSYLGRIGGEQELWINSNCSLGVPGIIYHEMLHALGFTHTHSREDRDTYINIISENITPGAESNFQTFTERGFAGTKTFGPYDFTSVMHYAATAGSVNGQPTMVPINPANVINPFTDDLSANDRAAVQSFVDYEIATRLSLTQIEEDLTRITGTQTIADSTYTSWLDHYESGGTREQMRTELANQAVVTNTITNHYLRIFSRVPDENELTAQRQILIAGGDLADSAAAIASSDLAKAEIQGFYQRIMDAVISDADLNTVVTTLGTEGSLQQLESDLIESITFQKKLVTTSREIHLKDPAQFNVNQWRDYIRNGNSLAQLRTQLENGTPIVSN